MSEQIQRKHKLKKVGEREYELLGNDGVTLWRITREGWEAPYWWELRRQRKPLGRWEKLDRPPFETRRDAIQAALRYEEPA